ncbi:unnamed protein product [Gadus morhua 'NCC']
MQERKGKSPRELQPWSSVSAAWRRRVLVEGRGVSLFYLDRPGSTLLPPCTRRLFRAALSWSTLKRTLPSDTTPVVKQRSEGAKATRVPAVIKPWSQRGQGVPAVIKPWSQRGQGGWGVPAVIKPWSQRGVGGLGRPGSDQALEPEGPGGWGDPAVIRPWSQRGVGGLGRPGSDQALEPEGCWWAGASRQ